jgi:hypothetical protein
MNPALETDPVVHPVPYLSQWESAELVPDIVSGAFNAADDPHWADSGATDPTEYAFWARHLCGIACLRMALAYWMPATPVPRAIDLAREATDAGAFVRTGEDVKGLLYRPFTRWVTPRFGLHAEVRTELPAAELPGLIAAGHLVMVSVYKTIRVLDPAPPKRGGHLVLAVGATPEGLLINNPSGFPGQSQKAHNVTWSDLDRFYAERGVVLGPPHHEVSSS